MDKLTLTFISCFQSESNLLSEILSLGPHECRTGTNPCPAEGTPSSIYSAVSSSRCADVGRSGPACTTSLALSACFNQRDFASFSEFLAFFEEVQCGHRPLEAAQYHLKNIQTVYTHGKPAANYDEIIYLRAGSRKARHYLADNRGHFDGVDNACYEPNTVSIGSLQQGAFTVFSKTTSVLPIPPLLNHSHRRSYPSTSRLYTRADMHPARSGEWRMATRYRILPSGRTCFCMCMIFPAGHQGVQQVPFLVPSKIATGFMKVNLGEGQWKHSGWHCRA